MEKSLVKKSRDRIAFVFFLSHEYFKYYILKLFLMSLMKETLTRKKHLKLNKFLFLSQFIKKSYVFSDNYNIQNCEAKENAFFFFTNNKFKYKITLNKFFVSSVYKCLFLTIAKS